MAKNHLLYHKLKFIIGYSIASIVIIVALGVSSLRFILTTANLYQDEVEQLASTLLKQPVKIGSMDAKLSGLVPTLIFHNVQLLSKKTKKSLFSLSRIDIGISSKALILHQEIIPTLVTIKGMNLHVTRTVEGDFKIKGVDLDGLNNTADNDSIIKNWLLQQGEVGLEDSSFTWVDEQKAGLTWFFEDVNFLLNKGNERYQLMMFAQLPKILGNDIQFSLDLEGDINTPQSWEIKSFVKSDGFKIHLIKDYIKHPDFYLMDGIADLELWLDWGKEEIKQLSGDVKLKDFTYQLNKKKPVQLKSLSGLFDTRRDENGLWNISLEKFNYASKSNVLSESNFSLAFDYNNKSIKDFYIKASHLKLRALSNIIIDNHLLDKKNEKRIKKLNFNGDVYDFQIAWKNKSLNKLIANFSGLDVDAWRYVPNIKELSGTVIFEQEHGQLSLLANNPSIGFPLVFRNDFKFFNLDADIDFVNTKQGLLLNVNHLLTNNNEVDGRTTAKLWVPYDDSSPHLDFQTYLTKGDASKISTYLPVGVMDKSLVKWIDKGILSGQLNSGSIVFNGKLDDFPFDNGEGKLNVDIKASNITVNYLDSWPKITKAKVKGTFSGQGLKLNISSAEAEKNELFNSTVEIPDFLNAELKLEMNIRSSTHSIIKYLSASPILSKQKNTIDSMRFGGDVTTSFKMSVPLNDEVEKNKPFSYLGSSKFNQSSVFMLKDKIDIKNIKGELFFTEKGLSSNNLSANVVGEKAVFSVKSTLEDKDIKVAIKGIMQPDILLKRFDIPGAKNISGKTAYDAVMTFPDNSNENHYTGIKLYSKLTGIQSQLPEFLNKNKKSDGSFTFYCGFPKKDRVQFGANFNNKGSAIIEIDQAGETSYLRKGAISFSGKKAVLPKKDVLYVDGSIKELTPAVWIDALDLNNKKGKSKPPFFVNPVVFNLNHLKVKTLDIDSDEESNVIRPKKLPTFEGIIKKFYFDDAYVGRLDFKTSKTKKGMHFDEVIASAKNMKLFSHGEWTYNNGDHKTNMNITFSSNDFGSMLTALDFSQVIKGGEAKSTGKIHWNGAPSQFSYDILNGDMRLTIKNGNIIEVDAGAGRLLGLFSLSALPRKLFGDFKDTVDDGFSFDIATGNIKIEEGDAYTDDYEISSAAADITISGRTGIADRDYENTVEVTPDVGGGLAGVTALLVNLPAGIGLWLIDKITGEQIDEASTKTYEITGSWDEPEFEEVTDE